MELPGAVSEPEEATISHLEDRRGEPVATFEAFAARESEPLLAMALGLTRDLDDALDLRQDALLRTLERWDDVAVHRNPAAWVRTVLFNRFADRHRSSRRLRVSLSRMARSRPEPADPASLSVDTAAFWEAASRLPRRQLEVLVLRVVDDASTKETAEVLGIAEGTVRTHLVAARGRMATALGMVNESETTTASRIAGKEES